MAASKDTPKDTASKTPAKRAGRSSRTLDDRELSFIVAGVKARAYELDAQIAELEADGHSLVVELLRGQAAFAWSLVQTLEDRCSRLVAHFDGDDA